jgi:signal transduction histidine kinase
MSGESRSSSSAPADRPIEAERDVTESRRITGDEAAARAERLAEEQAALRRVATLAARDATWTEVLGAVTDEAARVLEVEAVGMLRFEPDGIATLVAQSDTPWDPPPLGTRLPLDGENIIASVHRTGQAARMEDWSAATGAVAAMAQVLGVRCGVATPIVVEGRLWGTLVVATSQTTPLPADTESRTGKFTELVATFISNAESREALRRLADEQAALRRVATFVAQGVRPDEIFAAVSEEVDGLFGSDAWVLRFERDPPGIVFVGSSRSEAVPIGTRRALEDGMAAAEVHRTGRSARVDAMDASSAVASPIVVEGRLWGALAVSSSDGRLPPDAAQRLDKFTELVAIAVANAQSREALGVLAEEQAALRRVAELVARGVSPAGVFPAVAAEVSALFGSDVAAIVRFEDDGTATVLGDIGGPHEPGARVRLDPGYVMDAVRVTSRSARFDTDDPPAADTGSLVRSLGVRSAVASPIVVEGELWGAITAASLHGPLSPNAERRLTEFTELVATAVANTEAREDVTMLAEEQAALRRVATLVAQGAPAAAVFDAVAAEMERLLGADGVTLNRYERDDVTIVAHSGAGAAVARAGKRLSLTGDNVAAKVRSTQQAARMEDYTGSPGAIAELIRDIGVQSAVGAPIVVAGELWGVAITLWRREHAPPDDTEERMVQFAELLGTAIANADSRDQLTASRARLVTEADEARRRVVRDLHDGAQQRLVHAIVTLKLARRAFEAGDGTAESLVIEALRHAEEGNAELRELAHGILPAALTTRGLRAGVDALVARLDLPVRADLPAARLPAEIEASAYFVAAETLTNIVKHSHASHAEVTATVRDGVFQIDVRDDGIGGADPDGHGLVGMADRVSALGGEITIDSPAGCGTHVSARFPLSGDAHHI